MNTTDQIVQRLLYDLPNAINESVKEAIPVISKTAQKGWNIYLMGIRYDGISSIILNIIALIISLLFFFKAFPYLLKKINEDNYSDFLPMYFIFSVIGFIISTVFLINSICSLPESGKKALIPEVYIIQNTIDSSLKSLNGENK